MALGPALQLLLFSPLGLTVTELADSANITKQSMGELVKYLEKRGYIERQQSETDLRVWMIRFTPKGEEMMGIISELVTQIDEELVTKFGTERFCVLRQMLLEFLPIVRGLN
jgi:DNA-binding MarR family transcriptional regulator